ncbi:intracellular growth attenuator family protein [Edwardsiella anguillarum]|nr:intracellular growth attenuator family protein [Edwardsiella anguillarum]
MAALYPPGYRSSDRYRDLPKPSGGTPGRFLSLSDEATQFPLQPWGRSALLGAAALIALLLLLTTQSLSIP